MVESEQGEHRDDVGEGEVKRVKDEGVHDGRGWLLTMWDKSVACCW